jgi:ectoine hydroxylase-related dioxygenase (phytanoyl-CoA dioxygenase family)
MHRIQVLEMASEMFSNPRQASGETKVAATKRLSQDEIDRFNAEGFLAIDEITTPDEVTWIRGIYDRLFAEKVGWDKGDLFDFAGDTDDREKARLPQLLNPSRYEPALARTQFRANAEAMAKQLLGPRAYLIFEHAMMKPAHTGAETAWHQDRAFYARYTNYRAVTIWMPLQPVNRENGCMEFIPASDKQEVVTHRHLNDDPRVHGLEAMGVDSSKAVLCTLPAGGASFHGDRTLHHAGPNLSSEPRRAYALVFGVRDRQYTLHEDYPWNRGTTARDERARKALGPVERSAAAVKEWAKAILRH